MDKSPKTPIEVYQTLPEMKIELINGKIVWGGEQIQSDNEFEKAILDVIDRYMKEPSADHILFAAYLTECLRAYKKAVHT